MTRARVRTAGWLALGLCWLALVPGISAQGCSQCQQAMGQTPARTQAAYRKAILLLVCAGSGLFGVAVLTLRRIR